MRTPQTKPFPKKQGPKKARKEAITFNVKSRFEFLNGFSKRKAERKTKGNLINMKKEIQRKRDETNQYKHHVQKEYQKVMDAVRHNYGETESKSAQEQIPVVEEQTVFFPKADADPFGDVSIQISSLESHNFASLNRAMDKPKEGVKSAQPKAASTTSKKPKPVFAKFKQLTRSSKFLQKRKSKAKEGRTTKVKQGAKGKKKSQKKSK